MGVMRNHEGVPGCIREACCGAPAGRQTPDTKQKWPASVRRGMEAEVVWDRGRFRGWLRVCGWARAFLGAEPHPEEVKRLLPDRCTGSWGRQGQSGCAGPAAIPGERRATLDPAPLRKPPQPARARPHSPPPAPAGPGAALHGSRPTARASVRPSLGTRAGPPAPPPPQLRRGRK